MHFAFELFTIAWNVSPKLLGGGPNTSEIKELKR